MNIVPIVFAFDNNLVLPASICLFSLFKHAKVDTTYDIFILHHHKELLDMQYIDRVMTYFPKHKYRLCPVDDTFCTSFEIRGITTPAYYRLLIPKLITQYDKVIYSDVDVIFRLDLADLYNSIDLADDYVAGVNNLAHLNSDLGKHYGKLLGLDIKHIICSGFLVINSKKILQDNKIPTFLQLAKKQFKFQDQDIINIACRDRIKQLPPKYSILTYINEAIVRNKHLLMDLWSDEELQETLKCGNIHYNGRKPWQGYCVNFDIWWEYYRKSPVYDQQFYFDFYYNRLNELDQLPLLKRIKILVRYFVYGKRKNP